MLFLLPQGAAMRPPPTCLPACLPASRFCSTENVRSLVARAAQACFLLRVLSEHNIGRLAARLDDGARQQLRALRFRWALVGDGARCARRAAAGRGAGQWAGGGSGRHAGHAGATPQASTTRARYLPCPSASSPAAAIPPQLALTALFLLLLLLLLLQGVGGWRGWRGPGHAAHFCVGG